MHGFSHFYNRFPKDDQWIDVYAHILPSDERDTNQDETGTDKQRCSDEETSSNLQFYHDCMTYLLEAQKNPPTVAVKLNHGGKTVQWKAFLPLMIMMGDQLSQDTLCGWLKSNSGGAGRVH
ncbi:hypothetical protein G9A89_000600 [Geosiphon pyriformis]|nr:hypothetical protein G9A89_000600 [Geosiphon pyriformis]